VHSLGRPDHRLGPADRGLWPWSSAGVRREAVARGAAHPGGAGEPPRWRPPKTGRSCCISVAVSWRPSRLTCPAGTLRVTTCMS